MTMATVDIGKGIQLDVDVDSLKTRDAVFGHVVYIGLRNILMDSHAGVKRDECESDADYRAKSRAIAEKKLAAMMEGTLRAKGAGTQRASAADPVTAEALREARVFVGKKAKGWEKGTDSAIAWLTAIADKIGHELPDEPNGNDWKELVAAAIAYRAAKPESIATAQKIVELRQIEVDVEI